MNRRALLTGTAAAVSATVAGCTGVSGIRHLSVRPFDPSYVAEGAGDISPNQERAVERIRERGAAITYGHRRFNNGGEKRYLELEDGFHRVETEVTGEQLLRRDVLFADEDPSTEAAANAVAPEAVYSDADQRRIARVVKHEYVDGTRGYIFRGVPSNQTGLRPVPDYKYVELSTDPLQRPNRFDEVQPTGVFRLWVTYAHYTDTRYATTMIHVATNETELLTHLDEDGLVHHLESSTLTPDQRAVIETAIEERSYTEPWPLLREDDDAFEGLPLESHRDPETDRPYRIFRYDGEYYVWAVTHTD